MKYFYLFLIFISASSYSASSIKQHKCATCKNPSTSLKRKAKNFLYMDKQAIDCFDIDGILLKEPRRETTIANGRKISSLKKQDFNPNMVQFFKDRAEKVPVLVTSSYRNPEANVEVIKKWALYLG